MKVNQISTTLNSVYGEVLGTENMIQEDLSNIVSAGQFLSQNGAFGDNFDNYVGEIIDKVGRTIFVDRAYRSSDLGIWRDSWEYASMLEKIRCEVGNYTTNDEWILLDGDATPGSDYNATGIVDKLFGFVGPEVQAKYFNLKTTFRNKISITRKQLRSAFSGANEMIRFIAMIENRIRTKQEIAKQELERRVVTNLACAAYNGGNYIDLKSVLGSNKTFAEALKDQATLRGIAETITMTRKLMTEPGKNYSITKKFMNFTPEDLQRLVIMDDLDTALRFNLYGDTFNEEFVKLNGYRTVPYWQGRKQSGGASDALAARASINAKAIVDGESGTAGSAQVVTIGNLVGVLFDRDAAMICNEDPEVRSQYNADGNFTNFFYNYDCSFYNDFDENAIVFIWGNDGATGATPTMAQGGSSGKTVVTAISPAAGDGDSFKYMLGSAMPTVKVGDATPTTGWSDLTIGAVGTGTAITATAGQILTIVRINDSKVTEVTTKVLTADDIKA